jgi:glycosyltransferase involved in cell wall biosynthesis
MERILLPTPDYPPKRGGVARFLESLVNTFPNIRVEVLNALPGYKDMLKDFWNRRKTFDVILVSHVLPVGTAALLYRLCTGTQYDVILHGLDFDLGRSTVKRSVVMWLVLRFARRVFTNSKALAAEVKSFSKRSMIVLYPCVPPGLIEAAALVTPAHQRLDAGESIKLLTVSRLVERKGHLKVLDAILDLPNVQYTIVGDGQMRKSIQDKIEALGLQDRVTMLQHVSDGKLPELYGSHDVFVMPTTKTPTDREGFGIVYIEAGLFGLPVIATNQPGVDEAVIDGETGLLIEDTAEDLKAALERLVHDRELRLTLGKAGRSRVLAEFVSDVTMQSFGSLPTTPYALRPTPLISVVIPSYQHADSIAKCIDTVLAQTYERIQIIVVDDGSTDHTQQVLEKYKGRVTVIRQENRGGNAARNRGAQAATGDFIIFVDADAELKPAMLEVFLQTLEDHSEASYAYSGFKFGWKRFRGIPFDAERLRMVNFVMTTSLIRRGDFPGFDESLKRFQDWDLWLTMLKNGKMGVMVPGTWFTLRIDGTSRTGSSWLPAFMYALPWHWFGWKPVRVQKYEAARAIIAEKHSL